MRHKISLYLMVVFYVTAGMNHFRDPQFYTGLIPDYLPFHDWINTISGVAEILLGLGLIFSATRKACAHLIITMLVLFIPAHVYFIQIGSCIEGGLCVPEWIGWARLVVIHPLLIYWAWNNRE